MVLVNLVGTPPVPSFLLPPVMKREHQARHPPTFPQSHTITASHPPTITHLPTSGVLCCGGCCPPPRSPRRHCRGPHRQKTREVASLHGVDGGRVEPGGAQAGGEVGGGACHRFFFSDNGVFFGGGGGGGYDDNELDAWVKTIFDRWYMASPPPKPMSGFKKAF